MPKRPPTKWWNEKYREVRAGLREAHPDWKKETLDERTRMTVGNIWHNIMTPGQRRGRVREAEGKKALYVILRKGGLLDSSARLLASKYVKDFGGWTSHNLDWERGYREGERKTEDQMRGIRVQRSREPQLEKKQSRQVTYFTEEDNPVRIEQRHQRQAGLRYRAGERKEQHQAPGTVVASVGGHGPLHVPEFDEGYFYEDAPEEPSYVDVSDIIQGKAREGTGAKHPKIAEKEEEPKSPPKGYPTSRSEYADPTNFKYPLDTETHVRAALGYFSKPKNRKIYSAQKQKAIWQRIIRATKKYDIEVSPEVEDATVKQFYGQPIVLPLKIKRYSLWMPFTVKVATKSFSGVEKGDLIIEGFVSAPIKDLQGDILEPSALTEAKQAMTNAPHNLVWLDHESPYAKPVENQQTPPIGKFVASRMLKVGGLPALWARMVVNKAHPAFEKVAYELKNGFYNAFSMEFVPIRQMQKWMGNKLVNAISSIKYFATSLVRAPANEVATITRVYEKAFANSSRFIPIRVKSAMGYGQTIVMKGVKGKLSRARKKEAEPENEPEPEPELEAEPELEPEAEPEAEPEGEPEPEPARRGARIKEAEPEPEGEAEPEGEPEGDDDDDDDDDGTPEFPYSRKDYDRETGYVAPERATTAIGEWGDPALEKGRAVIKRIHRLEGYARVTGKAINLLGVYAQKQTLYLKAVAKAVGVETKGIDQGLAPDTLGVYEDFTTITDEQVPPEVKPGKLRPRPQRVIATFPTDDEGTVYSDSQEVGGEPIGVKAVRRMIKAIVRKEMDAAVSKKFVVRKGFAEHAGPIPESVRRMQAMQQDDGSIESQIAVLEAGGQ